MIAIVSTRFLEEYAFYKKKTNTSFLNNNLQRQYYIIIFTQKAVTYEKQMFEIFL